MSTSRPLTAVGIDAGGSRTVAIAMRGGELLRPYRGAAANPILYGIERSARNIAEAIHAASSGEAPAAIAVGVAGAGQVATANELLAALALRFPGSRIAVTDDAHIALRAAVVAGDGVAVIAGTGSIAYAEIGEGRYRSGGYGYLLGDEGSGYAIGLAGLRSLLRSYEGRAPSDGLAEQIAKRIGASRQNDVLAFVYQSEAPVARVASLAPLVLQCANESDRVANRIVQNSALELFEMLRALLRMAGWATTSGKELPLVLCGGLLTERSLLSYLLEMRIANELPAVRIVRDATPPHFGALAEARALLEQDHS